MPDVKIVSDHYTHGGLLEAIRTGIHKLGKTEGTVTLEKLEVDRGDALLAQLREFTSKVRTRSRPRVDGMNGLGALRTALRVIDAITPFNEME